MIEGRVRELVADIQAASDTWTPTERVDQIAGMEAAIGMLQALQSVEAVTFVDQRTAADKRAGVGAGSAGRGAPVEIAMTRGVSRATVDYQLSFARQLVEDHPATLAACLDGQVAQSAAKHIVHETEPLDPDQRRMIDPELAVLAGELTPGEVRKAAARKVAAVDPQAAQKKAEQARARKAVRAVMHGDGTGTLSALLPAERAVSCWQALDHTARGMRADGDDRSINDLMCDLLVERVTGQTKAENLNLEVGVVISATSMLGHDDQPAKLTGHRGGDYGVLPAGLARQLAGSDSSWARRLVCDPTDGRLVTMDTGRRRFDGALRKFLIYRDGVSRRPFSSSPIYDLDHIHEHAHGGPTSAANGQGLAVFDHHLRDLPGWAVEAINGDAGNGTHWTTPTGHTYQSRPPPILGHGNTGKPRRKRRRQPWPIVDLHTKRLPVEFGAIGHPPSRN